uniref:Uncharacterized protein n=1 Tax=Parascaris equorum TaxID=6256 RepID=A0A914SEN2_PAREQ
MHIVSTRLAHLDANANWVMQEVASIVRKSCEALCVHRNRQIQQQQDGSNGISLSSSEGQITVLNTLYPFSGGVYWTLPFKQPRLTTEPSGLGVDTESVFNSSDLLMSSKWRGCV